ncbi:MAG: FIST C-terminal domain-containing protein [Caryophanon sp.]|nr:FIST C-terminal domain-containing protein [Caryophanon sp.]
MTAIQVGKSIARDTARAFQEATAQISMNSKLLLFFASTIYDYEQLVSLFCAKFPQAKVVGVTTVGEINQDGIEENSLAVSAFTSADVKVEAVFMENIHKFPIFQRNELIQAAQSIGMNMQSRTPEKEGFAIVLPNGLINAEERMLSIVNSLFTSEGFPVFGGTAGDDAKFIATKTSLNERISTTSGIVIFVKLQADFKIYKESIFEPFSDDVLIATNVDVEGRKVYTFNGKPAAAEYARVVNMTVAQLEKNFMSHPLGFVGKHLSVGSPMCVNADQSISFYCQVARNAEMKVLKPMDVLQTMDQTVAKVKQDFQQLDGVFAINCILRKIQFQQTNLLAKVNERFQQLHNVFGFCSYGEQLQNEQINQTLILLAIGKKNGATS